MLLCIVALCFVACGEKQSNNKEKGSTTLENSSENIQDSTIEEETSTSNKEESTVIEEESTIVSSGDEEFKEEESTTLDKVVETTTKEKETTSKKEENTTKEEKTTTSNSSTIETTTERVTEFNKKIDVTMKVWVTLEDIQSGWIENRCEAFKKLHPEWNITFDVEVCDSGREVGTLDKDPVVGAAVYSYGSDVFLELKNKKYIVPFSTLYAGEIKKNNIDSTLKLVTVGNEIYGAPYTGDTWFMYYDKRVYTENDVKSLDAMMAKKAVAFPLYNTWYMYSFYEGNGCSLNGGTNDGSLGMDLGGQKAIDVTKYLIDKISTGKLVMDQYDESGVTSLCEGKVGACFSGSWSRDIIKSKLGDNMGVAEVPAYSLNGKDIQMYSFYNTKSYGVNPQSEAYRVCPEAVEAFAVFLSNPESQKLHYEMRNIFPVSKELIEGGSYSNDKVVQVQYNVIKNKSVMLPTNDTFNTYYWNNMGAFINELRNGGITYDNVDKKVEELNYLVNGGEPSKLEQDTSNNSENKKNDINAKLEETEKEVARLRKILLEEASTQYDMNQLSYEISMLWNGLMDYIWEALPEIVDANTMATLEKEQKEWLKYREEEIYLAESDFEGGSMAIMAGCNASSELTKERVYKLLEYCSK